MTLFNFSELVNINPRKNAHTTIWNTGLRYEKAALTLQYRRPYALDVIEGV